MEEEASPLWFLGIHDAITHPRLPFACRCAVSCRSWRSMLPYFIDIHLCVVYICSITNIKNSGLELHLLHARWRRWLLPVRFSKASPTKLSRAGTYDSKMLADVVNACRMAIYVVTAIVRVWATVRCHRSGGIMGSRRRWRAQVGLAPPAIAVSSAAGATMVAGYVRRRLNVWWRSVSPSPGARRGWRSSAYRWTRAAARICRVRHVFCARILRLLCILRLVRRRSYSPSIPRTGVLSLCLSTWGGGADASPSPDRIDVSGTVSMVRGVACFPAA